MTGKRDGPGLRPPMQSQMTVRPSKQLIQNHRKRICRISPFLCGGSGRIRTAGSGYPRIFALGFSSRSSRHTWRSTDELIDVSHHVAAAKLRAPARIPCNAVTRGDTAALRRPSPTGHPRQWATALGLKPTISPTHSNIPVSPRGDTFLCLPHSHHCRPQRPHAEPKSHEPKTPQQQVPQGH
jgi:hypothetical protein